MPARYPALVVEEADCADQQHRYSEKHQQHERERRHLQPRHGLLLIFIVRSASRGRSGEAVPRPAASGKPRQAETNSFHLRTI